MEKLVVIVCSLAFFLLWEFLAPFFKYPSSHWRKRVSNLFIALINGGMGMLFFSGLTSWVLQGSGTWGFGLLSFVALPWFISFGLGILLLDCWTYWWHRLNHIIPFLWKFHKVHHTDTEMDAVTALRFHPAEIAFSSILRIPLFLLLGVPPLTILWYDGILVSASIFNHGNFTLGPRLDRIVNWFLVTPIMHKIHHSVKIAEFKSNYSSVFSWWDRIFGSFKTLDDPSQIKLGLPLYRQSSWHSPWGILRTPFVNSQKKEILMKYDFDLIVIGGGSAGISAIRTAAGFGKKALLVEQDRLGGECTWSGCIPSKALIRSAHAVWEARSLSRFQGIKSPDTASIPAGWDSLKVLEYIRSVQEKVYAEEDPDAVARWGAEVLKGTATLTGPHQVTVAGKVYTASRIVLATGSENFIPPIPGLDQVPYLTNQTIFNLSSWPKTMTILGAGPIGIELAQSFQRLGTQVTVLEMAARILPREDQEITQLLHDRLVKEGIVLLTSAKVTAVSGGPGAIGCSFELGGKTQSVVSEVLLLGLGRRAVTKGFGLEEVGVKTGPMGILVKKNMRTTVSSISAAGDCTGIFPLSHNAGLQGVTASLDYLFPWPVRADYTHMLWAVFSDPELARIGLTEEEAIKKYGKRIQVVRQDLTALDRAKCDAVETGLAKWILNKRGRIIGAHILGPRAGELIHETQVVKALGKPFRVLQNIIHAYPTYSEIHKQAARKAFIESILAHPLVKLFRKKS